MNLFQRLFRKKKVPTEVDEAMFVAYVNTLTDYAVTSHDGYGTDFKSFMVGAANGLLMYEALQQGEFPPKYSQNIQGLLSLQIKQEK